MRRKPLMGLEYTKEKDGMLYPNLQISKNKEYDYRNIGKFGKRWKEYMMEIGDTLERAAHMNMLTIQTEEIILHQISYQLR